MWLTVPFPELICLLLLLRLAAPGWTWEVRPEVTINFLFRPVGGAPAVADEVSDAAAGGAVAVAAVDVSIGSSLGSLVMASSGLSFKIAVSVAPSSPEKYKG